MSRSSYPQRRGRVILCIDDNQDVLECEKMFLESFGFRVLTALSGRRGLELASMHSIDVVVVDYLMPGMNGQELALEMRRVRPQTPIILLSAELDIPQGALELVDIFVSKDSLTSQLLPALAQLHGCESMFDRSYDA